MRLKTTIRIAAWVPFIAVCVTAQATGRSEIAWLGLAYWVGMTVALTLVAWDMRRHGRRL